MADNFYENHQGREPPDGAGKMLQVSNAAVLESLEVVVDEGADGAAQGNDRQSGGRFKSRNQAEQVGAQDKQGQHRQKRSELSAAVADDVFTLVLNKAV